MFVTIISSLTYDFYNSLSTNSLNLIFFYLFTIRNDSIYFSFERISTSIDFYTLNIFKLNLISYTILHLFTLLQMLHLTIQYFLYLLDILYLKHHLCLITNKVIFIVNLIISYSKKIIATFP